MIAHIVKALALNEVRLRMRRVSTIVALLAVVAISWLMIVDPATGESMMVVDKTRVIYNSAALAVGSATLASILFGLGGFYLVRGRIAEDLRSGVGSVIGATPVGNALFLVSRWVGGVAYLGALMFTFMATIICLHLLRGEGPVQLWVYLQTYCLVLVPIIFFAVSCAILFDGVAPLMGKGGDVLYFILWMAQLSMMSMVEKAATAGLTPWFLLDFGGMVIAMFNLQNIVHLTSFAIGSSPFDPALAPIVMPDTIWTVETVLMRLATAVLALLPLLPAIALFHRFSPDRVKASRARARRSPLALLNGWLRPLGRLVHPLLRLATVLPGLAGQVLADVALALMAAPSAILGVLVALVAGLATPRADLAGVLTVAVAFWGVFVADLSTRDFQADTEGLTGAVPGGIDQRYARQLGAAVLLGFLFTGMVAVRWMAFDPLRAGALVAGVLALASLATLLGRLTHTSRTFVSLFLFALYVAVNAVKVPLVDAVGFNGVANVQSTLAYAAVALAAALMGYIWNSRQAH
ncbi:MAG: hypothetical protein V4463_22965 [Pseudomonadota bacterium]